MSSPNLQAMALFYAGAGIHVFPVDGKAPLTPHGFKDASTDRAQVEAWWSRHPSAGIGCPDYDVVDVDLYKPECQATWKTIRPLIPAGTPHNRTGGGGLQYLFKAGTLKDGRIGPGVDSRYAGRNYIILPPSPHRSGGRYETIVDVVTHKPKPAPEFPHASGSNGEFVDLVQRMGRGEKVTDGRNKAAWWRAVEILRTLPANIDLAAVETLVQAWVDVNCAGDLSQVDVAKQVRGAARFVANEQPAAAVVDGIVWRPLAEIEMRSVVFLDKPLLQADAFHLVTGRKGVGKGTLIAYYASRITRGELGPSRNVIWIGSEDSNAVDIKPRVMAAGGDPARIVVVEKGWIQLPRDVALIDEKMGELGEVGLLVVDPVGNHIAGKSSNSETDIRDAIGPLNALADTHKSVVIGVRHLSEKECSRGVLAGILGSSAWVQVPRAVIAAVRDNEDEQVTHVQVVAGNRLPAGTPGRMFKIEGVLLPGLDNEVTRATPAGDSHKDVETMLAQSGGTPQTKTADARTLILDLLEADGEQESDGFDARVARETGLSAKTVRNIRGELKTEGLVKAFPDKDEFGKIICWKVSRSLAGRP